MKSLINFTSQFKILKFKKTSLIVSAFLTSTTLSFAAPTAGTVTSGTANISQSNNTTNINQSTSKATINWQNFSIASNETVNFNQPNVNSITLNRVIGNEKSIINGALNANGQVWLLNSNGVLFGKDAKINTAGILATTSKLSDSDFNSNNYNFKNSTSNSIINEGTIEVSNNGSVILASNEVQNKGTIKAVKGKVHLVGADSYSLNLNGNSLVNLTVDKGVLDSLVKNSGTIISDGGEIYLTTNAVDELLKGVVNNTGIIEANSIDDLFGKVEVSSNIIVNNGEIKASGDIGGTITQTANMIIDAGITDVSAVKDAGTITQNSEQIKQSNLATLKADSQTANAGSINLISDVNNLNSSVYASGDMSAIGVNGGNINITASSVNVIGANITSTGTNSAGNIKIGGDWQGAKTTLDNATNTRVLNSNITNEGNDGKIVVWSEDETSFNSTILAQNSQVEISSKDTLNFSGVNVKANSLLLDPKNIEIKDSEGFDYFEINNPNNTAGDEFQIVAELSNGNLVATATGTDIGENLDVGAVYLFNNTGTLISTLTGSKSDDKIGSEGVTVLGNYNYVVASSNWDNGSTQNVGAVTLVDGANGISGIISSSNSLTGTRTNDKIGSNGVIALSNEKYVVASSNWDNGNTQNVGAVTLVDINDEIVNGTVSSSNSLIGTKSNDKIGNGGITALSNENYVVSSFSWGNGNIEEVGAVTLVDVDNNKNVTGDVSSTNSLIGSSFLDAIGINGITALNNGNYVVASSFWNYGTGAVTLVNVATNSNVTGNVSSSNSLIGTKAGDKVGNAGVTALSNEKYVVASSNWDNGNTQDVGAVTLVDVATNSNVTGNVSYSNSLIGTKAGDNVGNAGVTALSNEKYVVASSNWDNGNTQDVGAVTLVDVATNFNVTGNVSSSNSLTGTKTEDYVGNVGVTVLSNEKYVVASSKWDNENTQNVGAVTLVDISNDQIVNGTVSSSNSLIGTKAEDNVGNVGVTALSNGKYVVASSNWDNGNTQNVGAVTFWDKEVNISGTISLDNSFIGDYSVLTLNNDKIVLNNTSTSNGGTSFITDFSPASSDTIASATFSTNPSENSTISPDDIKALLDAGTDVNLQANNDITLSKALSVDNTAGDGGALTLQAGRSINLNANLTTDNRDFIALAGDTNAISDNTDAGTATITIANGVTIDAGTGKINLYANDGNFINNSGSITPFTASLTSIYLPSFTNATLNNLTVDNKRYNTTYVNGCLTTDCTLPTSGVSMLYSIAPKLIVTPNSNQTAVYGDTFLSTYSVSGYVNSDTENTSGITGTALFTAGTKSSSGNYVVDTHDVEYASGLLSSLGYLFKDDTSSTDEYTITPKALTVTADNKNRVYGESNPIFTQTITGYVNGENRTTANITGSANGTTTATNIDNVGTYTITGDIGDLAADNYTFNPDNGILTITPKALTITADNKNRVYGESNPIFTQTITGYVNGENRTTANITGSANGTTTATNIDNVGTYTITGDIGNLAADNYTFSPVNGILTITPKDITITANAITKIYGNLDSSLTYTSNVDLVSGDTFVGSLNRAGGEDVNTYAISKNTLAIDDGNSGNNYSVSYIGDNLTINKRDITLSADLITQIYGDNDSNLSVSIDSGSLGSETVNDTLLNITGILSRESGTNVENYDVNLGTGSKANNYNITFVNDNNAFSITSKEVILSANKTYDGTRSLTGNDITIITGVGSETLTYTNATTNNSHVATSNKYIDSITLVNATDGSGGLANNYKLPELTYNATKNSVIITPAIITPTISNIEYTQIYDSDRTADINPSYTFTGLVDSDESVVLTNTSKLYNDKDVLDANLITVNGLEISSIIGGTKGSVISDYTLDSTSKTVNATITKARLTVSADDLTKVYGQDDATLTYTANGLVGSDTLTGSLKREAGENVADYAILEDSILENSNYDITFTNGKYTITPKEINYNFGTEIEAGTSNGSEYLLNELFSKSTLFGDNSSLISNDDYEFIYNGNSVRGFTDANTYYPISLRLLNNNFLLGDRNYYGTVIIKDKFTFDFNKIIPRIINSNKIKFNTTNYNEQIKRINTILESLKTKFEISENEEEKKRVKEILESLY